MADNSENRIAQLENRLRLLEQKYATHQHDNIDGTNILRKVILLDQDQLLRVGFYGVASFPVLSPGAAAEQFGFGIIANKQLGNGGIGTQTDGMQMNFLHQPNNASLQSFINGYRGPIVTSLQGTSITVTAAGNTVTIVGYNFATNSLAGALIDIFASDGSLVETQTIASNTSTVVTISGTWANTTSGGTFQIYVPVFVGSADTIWQRFYCNEGTPGGIRFGVGPTNGGQNGLLYMDATGDIYWRDKGGVSTKLN